MEPLPGPPSPTLWQDYETRHRYVLGLPFPVLATVVLDVRAPLVDRSYVAEGHRWLAGMCEREDFRYRYWLDTHQGYQERGLLSTDGKLIYVGYDLEARQCFERVLEYANRPQCLAILGRLREPDYEGRGLWWDAMLDEGYSPRQAPDLALSRAL